MLLSHTQGSTDLPLVDETIGAHLARIVERFADREALVVRHERDRASYRQLWEQVDATARGLIARGVQKGDRVGIWSPNRHEWVLVQYATARIGAILRQHQPGLPARRAPLRAREVRRGPARHGDGDGRATRGGRNGRA